MQSVFTIVTSRSHDGDINEWYKINPVEVLGSGQFGTVYGGHSLKTNEHVAIKVIDKTRFSDQEEKIHHEVDILHEITHPGIIRLHAMFDTPEKVLFHQRATLSLYPSLAVLFGHGKVAFGHARNDSQSTHQTSQ